MELDVGDVDLDVQPVDDRTLLSPDVLETIVRAVLARLEDRLASGQHARDERGMWNSVRGG
jgi:hypothetical protein